MTSLQRIIVATDFSGPATRATARAARLPLADGAEVRLLHCAPHLPAKAKAAAMARIREQLGAVKEGLARSKHMKVVTEIAEGDPFVEIVRAARRGHADLVVLGRHSKRGLDWSLGTTAERVVRKGSTPVLVVGPEPVRPYLRPVVAVDLSDVSRTVLELARRVLGTAVPLRLVHAYHPPFDGFMRMSMPRAELQSFRAEYRDQAREGVRELIARFGEGAPAWHASVKDGDPRSVVLREIKKHHADVVVLGTHGRSGLSHLLLGSVAESILREAPCDVLVGRPERFTFEMP